VISMDYVKAYRKVHMHACLEVMEIYYEMIEAPAFRGLMWRKRDYNTLVSVDERSEQSHVKEPSVSLILGMVKW
jgi:hypothetical protein